MTSDISKDSLLYSTADEILADVKEMYSKKDNTLELYVIESQLQDLKEGDMIVTKYFTQLTRTWKQLDAYEVYNWTCTADSRRYK